MDIVRMLIPTKLHHTTMRSQPIETYLTLLLATDSSIQTIHMKVTIMTILIDMFNQDIQVHTKNKSYSIYTQLLAI